MRQRSWIAAAARLARTGAAVLEDQDELAMGRMFTVARKIAKQEGIAEDGYRLIVNCNTHGKQEVYHIHMHLVGGRPLGSMLAS